MANDPYCGNCGYSFVGLTESSKCPECGKPIVEVLERGPRFAKGRRYQSSVILFGLPLIHVAFGPHGDEATGKAHGIIALGDYARGWLAVGGAARGIIAVGGRAVGVISLGGFSVGAIAFGGWAMGGLAVGGGSLGLLAFGGGAIGGAAVGGGAIGVYAAGGGVYGKYIIAPGRKDPEALELFAPLSAFSGRTMIANPIKLMILVTILPPLVFATLAVLFSIPLALILFIAYLRQTRAGPAR